MTKLKIRKSVSISNTITNVKTVEIVVFSVAISVEKREKDFRSSIEGFPKEQLRKSLTSEKNVLPGASDIGQEKTLQNIGSFDKANLKHTQTAESKPTVCK